MVQRINESVPLLEVVPSGTLFVDDKWAGYVPDYHFFSTNVLATAAIEFVKSMAEAKGQDIDLDNSMEIVQALIDFNGLVVATRSEDSVVNEADYDPGFVYYEVRHIDGDLSKQDVKDLVNSREVKDESAIRRVIINRDGIAEPGPWTRVELLFPAFFDTVGGLLTRPSKEIVNQLKSPGPKNNLKAEFRLYINRQREPRLKLKTTEWIATYLGPYDDSMFAVSRKLDDSSPQKLIAWSRLVEIHRR